jgi:biopolymer transport protein ExbD
MITRPLDLASMLRRAPRSFDWVFYVNFALIVLFFVLFGSRFVLSPALAIEGEDMVLPKMPESSVGQTASTLVVSVKANGQTFVDTSSVSEEQLKRWFAERARSSPGARVLILADVAVRADKLAAVVSAAKEAGLFPWLAVEPVKSGAGVE